MKKVLQDFKVRFVPSFVIISTLWSSLPQIHMHCFSNTPDFTATSLSTHYIGLQVWNPLLSPLPLSPRLSTGVITYSTTYLLTPNVLQLLLSLYATGILEAEAGIRDEHGEGRNAEGHDTWRRVRTVSCSGFECIQGVPCARSGRRETLSMITMTFSTFSLHLDLPPVHPTPTAPTSFNLSGVHKHVVQVPSPQQEPLPLLRRNGQFQTLSCLAEILVQANTTLRLYGIMFAFGG